MEAALASNAIQRICFFINPPSLFIKMGTVCAAPCLIDALKLRHAARQRVTDVEVDGVVVSCIRVIRSNVPRVPREIFVLADQIDGAEAWIRPNGLVETEGDFLDR